MRVAGGTGGPGAALFIYNDVNVIRISLPTLVVAAPREVQVLMYKLDREGELYSVRRTRRRRVTDGRNKRTTRAMIFSKRMVL